MKRHFILSVLWIFGTAACLNGEVRLPSIFGDHMVLQQGQKLPVWGWAEPGEEVAVSIGDKTAHVTTGKDGKWRVELEPISVSGNPLEIVVKGRNELKLADVLVGDVWICSGQSNMEFGLSRAHNAATELPKADCPQIRLFLVAKKNSIQAQDDVAGKWEICTPATAARFSAVGYFFGQDIYGAFHQPIGLIGTYWGGTPAQAWTSLDGLRKDAELKGHVQAAEKLIANYPQASVVYKDKMAEYNEAKKKWDEQYGAANAAALNTWKSEAATLATEGKPAPPMPKPEP
ncbi:MAG: sialate O-acetylesterase, partial [Methylacidiphilales bacterium]|nr:sialate O-acetylesterase [Candidatus Methylacidiphilales bacterium]